MQDETEEKLKLVEVYNQRLIERERRREDVVKQELFHQKRHQVSQTSLMTIPCYVIIFQALDCSVQKSDLSKARIQCDFLTSGSSICVWNNMMSLLKGSS